MSISVIPPSLSVTVNLPSIPQLPPLPTIPSIPNPFSVPNLSSIDTGDFAGSPGPTDASDVVGVFDDSFNQLFDLARPIKANVTPSSRIMDHPVETGTTISDHQIFLPTEMELSLICTTEEYKSVYQQIKSAYLVGSTLIVQTKADTYLNMLIQAIPHDETPELFDVIQVAVKLREGKFVDTQYQTIAAKDVKNPNDQSTVNTGETTPKSTTTIAQNIVGLFAN